MPYEEDYVPDYNYDRCIPMLCIRHHNLKSGTPAYLNERKCDDCKIEQEARAEHCHFAATLDLRLSGWQSCTLVGSNTILVEGATLVAGNIHVGKIDPVRIFLYSPAIQKAVEKQRPQKPKLSEVMYKHPLWKQLEKREHPSVRELEDLLLNHWSPLNGHLLHTLKSTQAHQFLSKHYTLSGVDTVVCSWKEALVIEKMIKEMPDDST